MYMIELSINKAYEYTEKEVESMNKIQQMYITEWTNAMNTMSEMMKKEDDA